MEPLKPTNDPAANQPNVDGVSAPNSSPAPSEAPTSSTDPVSPEPVVAPTESPVVSPTETPAAPQVSQPQVIPAAAPTVAEPQVADSSTPQMFVGGADQAQVASSLPVGGTVPAGGGKKRWLVPALVAGVALVLLGGGYVFGIYLPNRPAAVYSSSLERTGKAVDALVDYSNTVSKKDYKSYAVTGKVTAKTGSGSFDATVDGKFDEQANADVTVKADVVGEQINADIKSVHGQGNTTPDVYIRLTGIKQALDSFGASSLDSLDGQWVSVDHTILDTYSQSLKQSIDGSTAASTMATSPTPAQLTDALQKVQVVNKQYLFTTDSSKAVLTQQKFIGKETKDGRSVDHYKVGYNKDHLEAYVTAVGSALDSSSLNAWSKQANGGKSLSQTIDLDSLKQSVKDANGNYSFDLWADTKTKLVHSLQFADPSDPKSTLTLSQNYTGGDVYPFELSFAGQTGGTSQTASVKLSIDKKTDKVTGSVALNEADVNVSMNYDVTPSNNAVSVTAPTGAQPIMNVLSKLGLSGGL